MRGMFWVNERGKLDFSLLGDKDGGEELKALKKDWESFLDSSGEEREKYLRALEIEFSLSSMAEAEDDAAKDFFAEVLSDKKYQQQATDVRASIAELKERLKVKNEADKA